MFFLAPKGKNQLSFWAGCNGKGLMFLLVREGFDAISRLCFPSYLALEISMPPLQGFLKLTFFFCGSFELKKSVWLNVVCAIFQGKRVGVLYTRLMQPPYYNAYSTNYDVPYTG